MRYEEQSGFQVAFFDNAKLEHRWGELEEVLLSAFESSEFMCEGWDPNRPAQHAREGVEGRLGPSIGHLIALGSTNDEIQGGFLCIPTACPDTSNGTADVGWIFISPLVKSMRIRLAIMDALINTACDIGRTAGFKRLVTEMGTVAGAKALSRRYGILHDPTPDQPNRWTKDLTI